MALALDYNAEISRIAALEAEDMARSRLLDLRRKQFALLLQVVRFY